MSSPARAAWLQPSPALPPDGQSGNSVAVQVAAVVGAAATTGFLVAAKPIVPIALLGLGIATYAFLRFPWLVLSSILLTRAAFDTSESFASFGGTNLIGLVNAGVAFGGGLALLLSRRRRLPAHWLVYPFALFLLLGAVSLRSSRLPSVGFQAWLPLVALLVLFCWAALLARDERDLRRFAWLTLLSSPVPIAVAMWQFATGSTTITKDGAYHVVSGTFSQANGFAFYCMVLIAVGIVVLRDRTSAKQRAFVVSLVSLATVCLFLTYTRAAWMALLLVLVIMGVLHFRGVLATLAVLAAVTLLAAPVLVGAIEDRFSDVSGESSSDRSSWDWRVHNWAGMVGYVDDKPLTGYGLGSYKALTWERFGQREREFSRIDSPEDGIVAHNDFLNMAVELGFPGLALWIWILLGLTLLAWRARVLEGARPYAVTCFALMIALVMLSGDDNVQSYSVMLLYPVVLLGALAGRLQRAKRPGSTSATA